MTLAEGLKQKDDHEFKACWGYVVWVIGQLGLQCEKAQWHLPSPIMRTGVWILASVFSGSQAACNSNPKDPTPSFDLCIGTGTETDKQTQTYTHNKQNVSLNNNNIKKNKKQIIINKSWKYLWRSLNGRLPVRLRILHLLVPCQHEEKDHKTASAEARLRAQHTAFLSDST